MPTFTKAEMLEELSIIFLFEADHIMLGASKSAAESFIGFEASDGEYLNEKTERVDLKRFSISGSFERGYEFAFQPGAFNTLGEHEVQDLMVFMAGVPRVGGVSSGGETHQFMNPEGKCQSVADAVFARWKLEWEHRDNITSEFTLRELALLANMTEGAVRNALADKSEHGLRAIEGTRNPIKIEGNEAKRWLSSRRGFIPGPASQKDNRLVTESLRKIETAESFGRLISSLIEPSANIAITNLEGWKSGSFEFDRNDAANLARALRLDVPLFVGKALEVSLRRNGN